jgi:hypothetical protein
MVAFVSQLHLSMMGRVSWPMLSQDPRPSRPRDDDHRRGSCFPLCPHGNAHLQIRLCGSGAMSYVLSMQLNSRQRLGQDAR